MSDTTGDWWHLYRHLAPEIPGTVLLSRVHANAVAGAAPPPLNDVDFSGRAIRRHCAKMRENADNEELLAELSLELEAMVRVKAANMRIKKDIALSLGSKFLKWPDNAEFYHVFRLYTLQLPRKKAQPNGPRKG